MSIDSFIKKHASLSEDYTFYDGQVTLRYDIKNHKYLLKTEHGWEEQDGVTTICHIIDKSQVLMAWACKVMGQKLIETSKSFLGDSGLLFFSEADLEKLVLEAKKAKDEHLEDAGAVGNAAHEWIEKYIKAAMADRDFPDPYPEDERAISCCQAMLKWAKAHNVKFLHTEKKIYSRTFKYAGTMDGLAEIDSCDDPSCCPKPFVGRLCVVDWKTSNHLYIEYILQVLAYKQAYEEEFGVHIEDCWIIRLGKDDALFEPWHLTGDILKLGFNSFIDCLNLTRSIEKVENWLQERNDLAKAERKAARQTKKRDKDAVACPKSKTYKGTRKPTCVLGTDGGPCEACMSKYLLTQERKHGSIETVVPYSRSSLAGHES